MRKIYEEEKAALKSKLAKLNQDNKALMDRIVDAELAVESNKQVDQEGTAQIAPKKAAIVSVAERSNIHAIDADLSDVEKPVKQRGRKVPGTKRKASPDVGAKRSRKKVVEKESTHSPPNVTPMVVEEKEQQYANDLHDDRAVSDDEPGATTTAKSAKAKKTTKKDSRAQSKSDMEITESSVFGTGRTLDVDAENESTKLPSPPKAKRATKSKAMQRIHNYNEDDAEDDIVSGAGDEPEYAPSPKTEKSSRTKASKRAPALSERDSDNKDGTFDLSFSREAAADETTKKPTHSFLTTKAAAKVPLKVRCIVVSN
jgi:hypothetical protein